MISLHNQQRALGATGLQVSPIGLGTVKLGRNTGVKYPQSFVIPDDQTALALLSQANELGINLLDTAPAYGNSEERLGGLLKGQRQQWLICSKAGEEFNAATGDSDYIFTPDHIRFSVERSLKRLNTDYIDIFLIHSDGNDRTIIEDFGALKTLETLKKEGKIRATGMSTKTVEGGILAAQHADCVMATWNLAYDDELPVIEFCQQHNKGVLIKKALASGHISKELVSKELPRKERSKDPVADSFKMILGHPGVTSAIIGTINQQHLTDNVLKACRAARL